MTYATKRGGSTGYAKPGKTEKGAAGAKVGGKPIGMRQDFKRTGSIAGLKAPGTPNNANRAPVASKGPESYGGMTDYNSGHSSHKGNPY
jgi:hypothetical protein